MLVIPGRELGGVMWCGGVERVVVVGIVSGLGEQADVCLLIQYPYQTISPHHLYVYIIYNIICIFYIHK
jgi:hypothetical protein